MPLSSMAWFRATLITVALVVHGIYAFPAPHKVTPRDLKSPEGREELARWSSTLEGVGLDLPPERLGPLVRTWSARAADLHKSLKAPFRPFMRITGTGQAWGLFASPDTYPHRLEVHIHVDHRWEPVFVRNHAEHDFMDRTFRYRRVRGIYDGSTTKQRVVFWNFARWVARETLLAYPDADRVRLQMVQTHTTMPWEDPDPLEEPRVRRIFKRSALLPEDGLIP